MVQNQVHSHLADVFFGQTGIVVYVCFSPVAERTDVLFEEKLVLPHGAASAPPSMISE